MKKTTITILVILMLLLTAGFPAYYIHLTEEYDEEVFYRMELEDELNRVIRENDSLRNECLIKDIDLGRYESVIFQLEPVDQAKVEALLSRSE